MIPVDITSARSPVLSEATAAPTITTTAASAALASTTGVNQGQPGNLTSSAVGQLFQAQVVAQLEDGSFVVNVGDNVMRMALPAGTTVGNTLQLTLLATDPRPSFLLEQQNDAGSALLSSAAKIINTVLQTAQQTGASTSLVGKTALVDSPDASTPKLASALQDSVEFSGLFYESHVSQWVNGQRPFSELLQEPQMQNQANTAETAGKSSANNTGTVLQRSATTGTELSRLIDNARTSPSSSTLLNNHTLPQEADTVVRNPTTISQATAQNINLQLNTLEQQKISWQGELWPGQRMEWEVSDNTPKGQQNNAGEPESSWQSVVRFDLPSLGKISAVINLAGGHVRIQVNTPSPNTVDTLKAHGTDLAKALDAAGSPLDSLIIKQDDKA